MRGFPFSKIEHDLLSIRHGALPLSVYYSGPTRHFPAPWNGIKKHLNSRNGRMRNLSVLSTASRSISNRRNFSLTKYRCATPVVSASQSTAPKPVLEPYRPPTSGLLSHLPSSIIPYAELIRLDKPTGTYYLFFPCLFSTLLAGMTTLVKWADLVLSTSPFPMALEGEKAEKLLLLGI